MMWMLRVKHIYNFSLFHANYIPLLHAFTSIIYHFIAFPRTNLLTRCQVPVTVFFAVFEFQKSCTGKVRGKIHEKLGSPNTSRRRMSQKIAWRGATRGPRGSQARAHPDPRLETAWGPPGPLASHLRLLKAP